MVKVRYLFVEKANGEIEYSKAVDVEQRHLDDGYKLLPKENQKKILKYWLEDFDE